MSPVHTFGSHLLSPFTTCFAAADELKERLAEVSEFYRDKSLCEGKDCHRLLVQVRAPVIAQKHVRGSDWKNAMTNQK